MTTQRSTGRAPVGVVDVGGSHVTAAALDPAALGPAALDPSARVPSARAAAPGAGLEARHPWTEHAAVVDPHAPLDVLLEQLTAPARAVVDGLADSAPPRGWSVAMPGPFDYAAGSGSFEGVDKFASLSGVDLRGAFADRLGVAPQAVRFCNDAVAYGIGEWAAGAGRRAERVVCLTLGTGVGSAFLQGGAEVDSGPLVPPHGEVHRLTIDGRPLEQTMSSPALRDAHRERSGEDRSVEEVCALARAGDGAAAEVLEAALGALGAALATWVDRFDAEVVVVGGSIARSWDVVAPPFRAGLTSAGVAVAVVPALLGSSAPLVGAAVAWDGGNAAR
ncbi:ROK family protein [Curtobacterium sp. MCSS17_008]|uniref:ROK family protein n=1 Tax=Curtobacterium sp. MCSS17_008 TaxID=2175647 RepID=UPI001C64C4AE|nr:ROK family protein [Curtobacterium sp. MCSS17_008]